MEEKVLPLEGVKRFDTASSREQEGHSATVVESQKRCQRQFRPDSISNHR